MDNVGMSQLHEINPFTSQERALVTSWAAAVAWVPGCGKHLIKSGGQVELPVSVTLSATELALYDSNSAWSNVSAGIGNGPGNAPGVTTKGKAAS
jgi:hypothetical protein